MSFEETESQDVRKIEDAHVKTKYNFQKLTPIKDADIAGYEDALHFVFDNDDIKNVAISGGYSAGKSSVIETFKIRNSNIRFMNISLAHFESTKQTLKKESSEADDSKKTDKVNNENSDYSEFNQAIVEGKIINQLIHQIDPEKIPLTKFKIRQKTSLGKIIKYTIYIMIFFVLSVYMAYFNSWCEFVGLLTQEWIKGLLLWTTNRVWLLLSGAVCTAILGLVVYSLIKIQKDKNIFKKVKLQGNEIEIFENTEESYFDKYLNEVLYLFDNSGADVIVFEDMDRYNVNQIFEKLREINTLVNCKKKKPVRFFYLLRDNIFISKDRTKFFDFIVPIVPVVDGSNSYDQFIEHFKEGGILDLFEMDFLQGLSLYVDDMRILKNIYNEFVIYYNRIQSTELRNNKLLAIIVYKNIFPKDFNDLQYGVGFVHTLFESKEGIQKQLINEIDVQIKKIKENISLINQEILKSVEELDATYIILGHSIRSVAGKGVSEYETQSQLVKAIKNNPNTIYATHDGYNTYKVNFAANFDDLLRKEEYVKRKNIIEEKSNNQFKKLQTEIVQLEDKKSVIQNSRFKELVNKKNINDIFSISFTNEIGEENKFEEIKGSPYFALIKYLVRNGYIDETYPDYMTYFYENSLSRIDKIFLRSITDEMPKEYGYSLINPNLVLSRLQINDFDREEVLNYDLLCFLLKSRESKNMYLIRFLQQLRETKKYDFIGKFLGTRRYVAEFIESINHLWPSLARSIITESNYSDIQIKQYIIDALYFSSNEDIKNLNQSNCLTACISEASDFLNINDPIVNKIINGFILLEVKFKSIEYNMSNKELFIEAYKNNMYELTFEHISLLLEKVYNITKSKDYKIKNYTLIASKRDEPLLNYVNQNINQYMDIILKNCDKCINDEEPAVLAVINNLDIKEDKKIEYINFLNTVIESIENISDKILWSLLLQQKKVKYSTNNILKYFFQSDQGLDAILIEFINTGVGDVSFIYDSIDNTFGEGSAAKFYKSIITCNELANEKYEEVLNSLNRIYSSFPFKELTNEKIAILIR